MFFFFQRKSHKPIVKDQNFIGLMRLKNKSKGRDTREKKNYLGAALAAVGAADEFDVATAMFVSSSIPAFESLKTECEDKSERRSRTKKKKITHRDQIRVRARSNHG